MKKLSVVTINFNDRPGLVKTIEKLGPQKSVAWEWVVIDGASNDGSQNELENNSSLFDVVVSESDDGIYDAMNKGIRSSSGEYLLFINSGDWVEDGAIEKVLDLLSADNSSEILLYDGKVIYHDLVSRRRVARDLSKSSYGIPALHQSTVYKRSCMPSGGYDLNYKICGDHWMAAAYWKSRRRGRVVNEVVGVHPIHGGAASRSYVQTFRESFLIERNYCERNLAVCFISMVKRFRSRIAVYLITRRFILSFRLFRELLFGGELVRQEGKRVG